MGKGMGEMADLLMQEEMYAEYEEEMQREEESGETMELGGTSKENGVLFIGDEYNRNYIYNTFIYAASIKKRGGKCINYKQKNIATEINSGKYSAIVITCNLDGYSAGRLDYERMASDFETTFKNFKQDLKQFVELKGGVVVIASPSHDYGVDELCNRIFDQLEWVKSRSGMT